MSVWTTRFLGIALLGVVVLHSPAIAQMATFEGRSIYKLDPVAKESTGKQILEALLSNDDMQAMAEIAPYDIIRRLAKPVGRLTLEYKKQPHSPKRKGAYCTASLISKNLIITNHHCVPGDGNVQKALLTMGYLKPRTRRGVAQYPVDLKPLEASKDLDYAILKVEGEPGTEWGAVPLSTNTPKSRSTLFVIHHPGGYPQYITRGRCQTSSPAIDGDDILHLCDTLPGSSGAPIFDNSTRRVVGLHYGSISLKKLNAGKRIASLAKASALISRLVIRDTNVASQIEINFWNSVKNSKEPAILKTYLQKYPKGSFAPIARVLVQKLEDQIKKNATAQRKEAELRAAEEKKRKAEAARLAAERKAAKARQVAELRRAKAEAKRAQDALKAAETKRLAALQAAEVAHKAREKAEQAAAAAAKARLSSPTPAEATKKPEKDNILSQEQLTRQLQTELARVGCDPGKVDGKWGAKGQRALRQFVQKTNIAVITTNPTEEALKAVKSKTTIVCPRPVVKTQSAAKDKPKTNRKSRPRRRKKCITYAQCMSTVDETAGTSVGNQCMHLPATCP